MRKFKFRIWHLIKKRWLDPYAEEDPMMSLTEDCTNWGTTVYTYDRKTGDWSNLDSLDKDIVIQQFTGLTDAVGKEIYEGDIIQVFEWDSNLTNKMYQAEIIFDDEDAQFVAKELNGTHNLIIGNSSFCDINVQNCKVVGNIYEAVHLCTYGPAILDNREIKMVRF